MDKPRANVPAKAPKMANGTANNTAMGRLHFSYWAAKIKNTTSMPNNKAEAEELRAEFLKAPAEA